MATVVAVVTRPGPPPVRPGSVVVANAPPVVITRTPLSYRVVYRIEERDGTLSSDRVTVRRPFDGRVETFREPTPGTTLLNEEVTVLNRLELRSPTSGPTVLDVAPALAASDQRVDVVLDTAIAEGRLVERERRRVYGRLCQVYRAAQPLVQGLGASEIGDNDYSDVCIDEAGLILEEYWVESGAMLRSRIATEVTEDPEIPDAVFAVEAPTVAVEQGGGSARQLTPTAEPPGEFYRLRAPPEGFRLQGRYAVIAPQSTRSGSPVLRENLAVGLFDVYVRGPDTVIIDRGGTAVGSAPFPDVPDALTAEISGIGPAQLVIDTRLVEVRARLSRGRYIRVAGTLPPDELVAIAGSLEEVEGNGQLAAP